MRVAVILVTYFSQDCICDFLKSLSSLDQADFKLYWYDNGSGTSAVKDYKNHLKSCDFEREVVKVWRDENIGYAAAVNRLLDLSNEAAILLINPDVVFDSSWFYSAQNAVCQNGAQIAVSGACDSLGRRDTNIRRFPGIVKNILGDYGCPSAITNIDSHYLDFSCLMMSRSIFVTHGKLADFFMYGEDVDYMYRLKEVDYLNIWFIEKVRYVHNRSTSTNKRSLQAVSVAKAQRVVYANARLFVERHGLLHRILYQLTFIVGQLLRIIVFKNRSYHFDSLKYGTQLSVSVIKGAVYDGSMHEA